MVHNKKNPILVTIKLNFMYNNLVSEFEADGIKLSVFSINCIVHVVHVSNVCFKMRLYYSDGFRHLIPFTR